MKKSFLFIPLFMAMIITCQAQSANPFFQKWATPYEVPPFEKITVDNYKEAYLKGMQDHKAEIEAIASNVDIPNFKNTIVAYDQSGALYRTVGTVFGGVIGAQGTPELMKLQTELSPLLSKHRDEIMMNKNLFNRIKYVQDHKESYNLNKEESKLLSETYRDFVRGGALLSADDQNKLKKINEEISKLQTSFGQNLLAETGSYQLVVDKKEDLSGLPADLIASAANRANKAGKPGNWVFGLDNPSVMPFLQYADNRELRKQILEAYLNRCNQNNNKDNKEIIRQVVTLRDQRAHLLGNYKNYAEYALEDRMAKTPQAVYDLLDQIWAPALKVSKQERDEMQALIGNAFTLEAWDWRYYSEKIKQKKYNVSEEMLRPYFKSDNVRQGIFWVAKQLYGISFTELQNMPKYQSDVRVFLCKEASGKELGLLYIDLFARPGFKRGGAWCGSYRPQSYKNGVRVKPIATIVCNFTPPLGNEPALLTTDEVETFFHEFGHALHGLFRDVQYYGTSSVPRDFVELPSQIMEHWAFEPLVLAQYAKHYKTGKVLPKDLLDKITASSKFGQGFITLEYLAASYLDMDYHVAPNPETIQVTDFEAKTLSGRGLISQIPPRYRSTYFQHSMTGGYTAGYYSYIWAEVLDADAFEAFKETGNIFNPELAKRFRKYVLEPGGIDDAMDMYLNFRGKKPGIDALLKNRGLK